MTRPENINLYVSQLTIEVQDMLQQDTIAVITYQMPPFSEQVIIDFITVPEPLQAMLSACRGLVGESK